MWLLHGFFAALLLICIVAAAPLDLRVVNGTDTDIRKYPFMISLRGASGSHSCGGSILAPYFALTAAHCTNGGTPSRISIQFGVTVINSTGPNIARVKRIIQHAGYSPGNSYGNDISLLQVEQPFPIDYINVAPVKLPEFNFETAQVPAGSPGILAGWGLNATGGVIMRHLQEVNLKIYSDQECNERHNGSVSKNHICGGVDEGGKGQCSGDSGGPLLYKGDVQVGIVSWSIKPCTVAPYPGVYTKVSKYIDWIKRNMIIVP